MIDFLNGVRNVSTGNKLYSHPTVSSPVCMNAVKAALKLDSGTTKTLITDTGYSEGSINLAVNKLRELGELIRTRTGRAYIFTLRG